MVLVSGAWECQGPPAWILYSRRMAIRDRAEIWIMVALAWGLLAVLLTAVMRREPGEVRRRWRELTEASPRPGESVDVVGPQGELLEQITMAPAVATADAGETDAASEEQRVKNRQGIRRDATRSLFIFLLCVSCVVVGLVFGPFGSAEMPAPNIAAGVLFLIGGTACTYLLNFYSGALELLDHGYSETYLVNKGGGFYLWAMLGVIPAASFALGATGLARIDPGLALDWSPGWASVYAATGAIHAAICWRLMPDEEPPGRRRRLGQPTTAGAREGADVLISLALFLGLAMLLPAAIQIVGLAIGMTLRLAG